jgi:hypothetical protein
MAATNARRWSHEYIGWIIVPIAIVFVVLNLIFLGYYLRKYIYTKRDAKAAQAAEATQNVELGTLHIHAHPLPPLSLPPPYPSGKDESKKMITPKRGRIVSKLPSPDEYELEDIDITAKTPPATYDPTKR